MVDKPITYGQLREALETLRYCPHQLNGSHVVFRNPNRSLFVSLPDLPAGELARPVDLLRVQMALTNDGVIKADEFGSLFVINKGDHLIWTDPETQRQINVVAAAGERDGLVIIKQQGTLVPCPVEQLRKDREVVSNAPS